MERGPLVYPKQLAQEDREVVSIYRLLCHMQTDHITIIINGSDGSNRCEASKLFADQNLLTPSHPCLGSSLCFAEDSFVDPEYILLAFIKYVDDKWQD